MASPYTYTNHPDLFLKVGILAKEVSRLTTKLQNASLTLAETDLLECNRLLLERLLLLTQLVGHHHSQQAPSSTSPSLPSADLGSSSLSSSSSSSSARACSSSSSLHLTSKQPQRSKKLFPDRACRHCGTATTSQWRTGPVGPSTLCNACGIRYARAHRKLQLQQQERHEERSGAESPTSTSTSGLASPEVPPASPPALRGSVQFMLN